ncbi:MAG TPA: aldo/keto reductase, partial [Solirubrobacteraceae bacterium]|nr:aldo/keto reductase [Solirubrobacteraceae bacterium]
DGADVDSVRAAGVRERYFNKRGFAVLQALDEISAAHHVSPAAVALAWLRAQPTVLAPIASATSPQQLDELLAFTRLTLADSELQRLSQASA